MFTAHIKLKTYMKDAGTHTRVKHTEHAHTHGEETEREAISSVLSHAEWFTVWNLFPHGALLLPNLFTFLC